MAVPPDSNIWELALSHDRIVVSKDEEFFHLANRAGSSGRLLRIRVRNSRKDALLHLVLSKLSEIEGLFADAQRIGEICAGTQESVGL